MVAFRLKLVAKDKSLAKRKVEREEKERKARKERHDMEDKIKRLQHKASDAFESMSRMQEQLVKDKEVLGDVITFFKDRPRMRNTPRMMKRPAAKITTTEKEGADDSVLPVSISVGSFARRVSY
jgi:hypothetical protein